MFLFFIGQNDWLCLTCQQIRRERWLAVNLPWAAPLAWTNSRCCAPVLFAQTWLDSQIYKTAQTRGRFIRLQISTF